MAVVVGCDFNPLINCERTSTMDAVCSVTALSLSLSFVQWMNQIWLVVSGHVMDCLALRKGAFNERTNTRFGLFQVTLVLLYLIWNQLSSGIVEVAFFKTRLEFYCKLPSIYSTLPPIIGGVINTRTTSRLHFCCSMLLLASCLWCCSEHCTELFRLCVLLIPVNATVGTGPDAIVLKW